MTLTVHIDQDLKSLSTYFKKLLELRALLEADEDKFSPVVIDGRATEYPGTQFYASHLIRPSMVNGVYSYFEFWIQQLCRLIQESQGLLLSYRDIRGKSDLDVYQKYLSKVAGINLREVRSSFGRIDDLRIVRNKLIHNGGHVEESERNQLEQIKGVSIVFSLLIVGDEFIWDTLANAKRALVHVADNHSCKETRTSHNPRISI
jgi:hypothetical protein